MPGTQTQPNPPRPPKGQGKGGPNPGQQYGTIYIEVTVKCGLDEDGNLAEWWWSVTPDPGSPMANHGGGGHTDMIYWMVDVSSVSDGSKLDFAFDDSQGSSGVLMGPSQDGNETPWNSAWGLPEDYGVGSSRRMEITSAAPDHVPFKYTIYLTVLGEPVVIDPEIEMGAM